VLVVEPEMRLVLVQETAKELVVVLVQEVLQE